MVSGKYLSSVNDIKLGRTYLLGLADSVTGKVIPGGNSGKSGHVMVTDPDHYQALAGLDVCMDGTPKPTDGPGAGKVSMRVVESTGGKGLVDSWYAFLSVAKNGVFTVYRGSKHCQMPVRMIEVV
jgi:hypothetical protein